MISFPSSPTNGQLATADGRTWRYNAVDNTWNIVTNTESRIFAGTTPPADPLPGDLWLDLN